MSSIMTGLVWELPIVGDFGRPEKYVLLAYADHADQNGKNIFPSIELIAKKTGYEERAVQMITRSLTCLGYLVEDGQGPKGTNRWFIPLTRDQSGGAMIIPKPSQEPVKRGAKIAPLSKNAPEGNAPEGIAPELVEEVVKTKEEEGTQKIHFSELLQERLEAMGIYRQIWPEIQARLDAGWSEADIYAVMYWMGRANVDFTVVAQRFVARIREGTKAPEKYYPAEEPVEDPDPAGYEVVLPNDPENPQVRVLVEKQIQAAWENARNALDLKPAVMKYLEFVRPVSWDGRVLTLQVHSEKDRDWLEGHLTKTLERLLIGILDLGDVEVNFVTLKSQEAAKEAIYV